MLFRNGCIIILLAVLGVWSAAQNAQGASQPSASGATNSSAGSNPSTGIASPAVTDPAASNPAAAISTPGLQPSGSKPSAQSATAKAAGAAEHDSLLDLPPLPQGKVALQGGTLIRVDPVRNRLVMAPFQGKRAEIAFDVRTEFTRDGKKIALRDLKPGSHIYADTIWDGQHVFAKSVRIFTGTYQDQEHGQIIAFDPGNGSLRVRDELFPDPVELKLSSSTVIRKDQSVGSAADLRPGALVAIKFQPGSHGQVYQVDVLATPGSAFVFSGPVTHIDLLSRVLGVSNRSDSVIYDIHFDPARVRITPQLQEGAEVDVNATFDGTQYLANTIAIRSARESR
jgi:hypothetical protein